MVSCLGVVWLRLIILSYVFYLSDLLVKLWVWMILVMLWFLWR